MRRISGPDQIARDIVTGPAGGRHVARQRRSEPDLVMRYGAAHGAMRQAADILRVLELLPGLAARHLRNGLPPGGRA